MRMACGACGVSVSGWLPALAQQIAADPRRRRHCILLWMAGGPSQTDTFDMKPGHENGGEFKEIATNVPGVRFSEHLPRLAQHADKLAIIRSLKTKEGDHERGAYLMRTGQKPMSDINYPSVAAAVAKELASTDDSLPPYISVGPNRGPGQGGFGPGFLGPKFAPLMVAGGNMYAPAPAAGADGYAELKVDAIKPAPGVTASQAERRLELWRALEDGFLSGHASASPKAHQTVYDNALRMIHSEAATAFDLSQEPAKVRDAYGKGVFGQGCLLARRLVEQGVPFVEVSLELIVGRQFRLGHARQQFRGGQGAVSGAGCRLGVAHERSCGSRAAGIDDDRVDGRVRPHAANQRSGRTRSFSACLVVRAWRRRHRGRPGLRPHQPRWNGY